MLPNLKILICGAVFAPLLFAVTGAGVVLPDSYTRVGEMPEIGRPMMQRMIADEPAQTQFYIMTVARRSEELERLRELAVLEVIPAVAAAQPDLDLVKPAVIENPVSDSILATDVMAPTPRPTGAMGIVSETAAGSVHLRPAEIRAEAPDDTDLMQLAALLPTPADDLSGRAPVLLKVPLPPLRPTARTGGIHRRVLQRKPWAAPAPSDTLSQSLLLRSPTLPR